MIEQRHRVHLEFSITSSQLRVATTFWLSSLRLFSCIFREARGPTSTLLSRVGLEALVNSMLNASFSVGRNWQQVVSGWERKRRGRRQYQIQRVFSLVGHVHSLPRRRCHSQKAYGVVDTLHGGVLGVDEVVQQPVWILLVVLQEEARVSAGVSWQ